MTILKPSLSYPGHVGDLYLNNAFLLIFLLQVSFTYSHTHSNNVYIHKVIFFFLCLSSGSIGGISGFSILSKDTSTRSLEESGVKPWPALPLEPQLNNLSFFICINWVESRPNKRRLHQHWNKTKHSFIELLVATKFLQRKTPSDKKRINGSHTAAAILLQKCQYLLSAK